ncbi:hypothetical protein Tco_1002013 [Tanacetum coccineum]|uniref:Uncharacterized protein n=1 Tax=Tanacetum coccineum TaxID=301880 RepID=A0ABQ5F5D4_9ASTR
MDNPNITMEEYIRLQEEKALSRGETFNWQTATYGKMKYYEDEDDCFTKFESEFPAIVLDDTSEKRSLGNFFYWDYTSGTYDFKNEFPAIVYNDALTSKSDFLTEHIVSPLTYR